MSVYRRLEIPDAERYWAAQVKCRSGCPVGTDACSYVGAVAEGRLEDAYRIARATNPFVSICGRVCGAPCERACRRGSVDAPVTIRAIKRHACERHGTETGSSRAHRSGADLRMLPARGDHGDRVAVLGAGVAGLTVAHDLTHAGYAVTVFEAGPVPGGMLTLGVPRYRLPRALVKSEIAAILELGVELRLDSPVGVPGRTLSDLRREGYRAFFVGVGLQGSRSLDIPGAGLSGVVHGLEFLKLVNLGQQVEIGPRVVVIGGGNVAFDVARTALRRTDEEQAEGDTEAFRVTADIARSAARRRGVTDVHVVCLESRAEMPADSLEIEEGLHEGLQLHTSLGPRLIRGSDRVEGVEFARCLSVFDGERRFDPTFDEAQRETIPADTVILAVGQKARFDFLTDEDGVELTSRGLVEVDPETFQTSRPDVFAGGDVALGPRLFVDAIASGQAAARAIHDYLRRTTTRVALSGTFEDAAYRMDGGFECRARQLPPSRAPRREELPAAAEQLVELDYAQEDARAQAARCLRCDVQTSFDAERCIACNGCVDVCPADCLHLVALRAGDGSLRQALATAILNASGVSLAALLDSVRAERAAVMLKDESACIRCASCATRCPTHAFTMRRFRCHRELVSARGENPRLRY